MRFREIAEQVKAGTLTLDAHGHRIRERLIDRYEHYLAHSLGAGDGKWPLREGEDRAEQDAAMRQHFLWHLDRDYAEGECLYDLEQPCSACGENLRWVLLGNALSLQGYFDGQDFAHHPQGYTCPWAAPEPTAGTILVSSPLVFANFFRHVEDAPEDKKWSEEYSLNSLRGRANITKYKAVRNVAYGQMGNMSVGIFLHPDRRSVIVGDTFRSSLQKHKLAGRIVLDVWRWEATDMAGIPDFAQFEAENRHRGFVVLDVPHGIWNFVHYFDTTTSPSRGVYARLTLA